MSMFRSSAALREHVTYKILAWGPTGAGKSHFAFSAPEPAIVDFELRAAQLSHAFPPDHFQAVEPASIREGIAAIEALARGEVKCSTIVIDSLTRPYQTFTKIATTTRQNESGKSITETDWPAVNRRMLEITEPLFSIPAKHIITIARQATRMERQGNTFARKGVKMIGDEQRWPFDHDYVLHFAGRGQIFVQKSMSPHLPVDSIIRGDLDFARFVRLATGQESLDGKPAEPVKTQTTAALETALSLLSDEERHEIGALARSKDVKPARLLLHVRSITGGDKPLPRASFALLVDVLEKEQAA